MINQDDYDAEVKTIWFVLKKKKPPYTIVDRLKI